MPARQLPLSFLAGVGFDELVTFPGDVVLLGECGICTSDL